MPCPCARAGSGKPSSTRRGASRYNGAVGRILGTIVRRWAGDLGEADAAVLRAVLRRGAPRDRIRAARLLGRHDPAALATWIEDPVPGVRRAAATALGRSSVPAHRDRLVDRIAVEPMDAVRFELAVAATRCGARPDTTWSLLAKTTEREFLTTTGPRSPHLAIGPEATTLEWRFRQAVGWGAREVEPAETLRTLIEGALGDDPRIPIALALHQDPQDFAVLLHGMESGARRGRHIAAEAMGVHGDPRALPKLERLLRDTSVDPGFGFKSRRTASFALGRIGDPDSFPVLAKALDEEALDYEGRPGSGLGIQVPVRAAILHAIGEIGHPRGAQVVAGYLSHTHGSATGGLHLPAMAALVKLGAVSETRALLDADEGTAVHALSVLAALGRKDLVTIALGDSRPSVAHAARTLHGG
jgi:HEAT repeat protein